MIAVDSSVLVDVLAADPRFADSSEASLGRALAEGDVVICDAVVVISSGTGGMYPQRPGDRRPNGCG